MRPGGGKQKGAQFERDICKLLSQWISRGRYDDVFWRSAMSGGRATIGEAEAQAGDISSIRPIGRWLTGWAYMECKYYANLGMNSLFHFDLTGSNMIFSMWRESELQALEYRKRLLMFAKQNRMPSFVLMRKEEVIRFGLEKHYAIHYNAENLFMVWLDKFLKHAAIPERPRLVLKSRS